MRPNDERGEKVSSEKRGLRIERIRISSLVKLRAMTLGRVAGQKPGQ